MTSTDHSLAPAWPSCALGAWAAAWLAGRCSPDDVADTLDTLAELHTVDVSGPGDIAETVSDSPESGYGVLGLLGLLRGASGLEVRLPGPGAPQGLPPDPATEAAFGVGEVLLVDDGGQHPLALIPTEHDGSVRWRVMRYRVPVSAPATAPAGDIEYDLRDAVTEATELIGRLGGRTGTNPTDLRGAIRALTHRHLVELPPHEDQRATRLLGTAAQVEAIVTVANDGRVGFGQTAGHWESGDAQLRSLITLTRAARAAAINRVIGELMPAHR